MFVRSLRDLLRTGTVKSLASQNVCCSSISVIRNNQVPVVEAKQLDKQRIVDELVSQMKDDQLIYDKRLDANMDPFSENVDLEYLDDLVPPLESTFNLAAYINRMPTLQRLVDLGVNLYVLEQDREIAQYLIRLNFDRDVKDHLLFLKRIGIGDDELGTWITCNPIIFRESIENLKIRLEYLKSKKFTKEMVGTLIRRYPPFLNFPIKRVDAVLGSLQSQFNLTGDDIRSIVSRHPKVVHFSNIRFKQISFSLRDVMGLTDEQTRRVVVTTPSIFYRSRDKLENIFDYLHWTNGYSVELIVATPHCLTGNFNPIVARISYLKSLNLFQPDPTKPCFTSLEYLCLSKIPVFVEKCSHTSVLDFHRFLKSM